MLSAEKNELFTRVGPGTPCGNLLRRYWHPVCPSADLDAASPRRRVRLLGEDLVVFRHAEGAYSALAERCLHRGCSLYYGFVEHDGVRCAYHGWKFAPDGRCLEQPFEPAESTYKDRVRQGAYEVQELAGLLFVYMGPKPAPLLPRWDTCVRTDGTRKVQIRPTLNCNWLQCQENAVDTTHTYFLHGHMMKTKGLESASTRWFYRPILNYDFMPTEWGFEKRIEYGGDQPEDAVWPPAIFPNVLRIPEGPAENTHWRVPIDDEHTALFLVSFQPAKPGTVPEPQTEIPVEYFPSDITPSGDYAVDTFFSQDRMAWETQGAIFDRTRENLGVSDRGILMFRKMLEEQIHAVERGEDPLGTLRDPAKNVMIAFTKHSYNRLDGSREKVSR